MSYEPTTWAAGDTVTSAKLNKMEQGITNATSSPYFIIENNPNNSWKLNKTYKEVEDAFLIGKIPVFMTYDEENNFEFATIMSGIEHSLLTVYFNNNSYFFASNENDYLTIPD